MKRYGLPKQCLLRKSREFEQVYKQGKRLHGEGFTIIYLKNGLGYNRIGISVHRQIKGAVKRNRIKRIIRESFRLNKERYPQMADIIFAVKPAFLLQSPRAVEQAVTLLVQAVNIANDN